MQLRGIRIRPGYPGDAFGSSQCLGRRRPRVLLSERGARDIGQARKCYLPHWCCCHCSPCAAGRGNHEHRAASRVCDPARYDYPCMPWLTGADPILGFLLYCLAVLIFAVFMIYRIAPVYGKENALIYLSICSTVGSVSVMSVKAFGIALKLTFAGNNQFTHASTYVFIILTAVCILTQMNYFNKALACFPSNM